MMLIKTRVSYIEQVAGSLYANDKVMLSENSLDKLISSAEKIKEDNFCYQVTMINGAMVGFFCVPKNKDTKVTLFYIKQNARSQEYTDAFWKLVYETVYGGIYESLSSFNQENFDENISVKLPILGQLKFYGSNYTLK